MRRFIAAFAVGASVVLAAAATAVAATSTASWGQQHGVYVTVHVVGAPATAAGGISFRVVFDDGHVSTLTDGQSHFFAAHPGSYTVRVGETSPGILAQYAAKWGPETYTPFGDYSLTRVNQPTLAISDSYTVTVKHGFVTNLSVTMTLKGATAAVVQGPDRYGYCSIAGNTTATGVPIAPGTFLNLEFGQPGSDPHYTGATPAFWVEGVGVTCTLSPSQAAIASAATSKVNHTGGTGDSNTPDFYTFIPKA
jgi:hypothetical protein